MRRVAATPYLRRIAMDKKAKNKNKNNKDNSNDTKK